MIDKGLDSNLERRLASGLAPASGGFHDKMTVEYFGRIRSDIEPLLPRKAINIVDVGCGMGATIGWLKSRYPGARTTGLEGNGELRVHLETTVDQVHIVDLNGALPDCGSPDLILFLDVLEHLIEPARVLSTLTANLSPDATVIISLPNVAHLTVSLPLLMKGRFDYTESGILDRTHLRFFTRESALQMIGSAGLTVEAGLEAGFGGPLSSLFDKLTLGRLRDRISKQYIFAARRLPGPVATPPIRWGTA